MENKEQLARNYFKQGYNCAQSVFLAYAKDYGFDKTTALKLSSSFGGGMGRLREVCGAASSMFMIIGLEDGYTAIDDDDKSKTIHYQRIQELGKQFKEINGSLICRELLGLKEDEDTSYIPAKRTKEYYQNRPCENIIGNACKIIDKYLANKKAVNK